MDTRGNDAVPQGPDTGWRQEGIRQVDCEVCTGGQRRQGGLVVSSSNGMKRQRARSKNLSYCAGLHCTNSHDVRIFITILINQYTTVVAVALTINALCLIGGCTSASTGMLHTKTHAAFHFRSSALPLLNAPPQSSSKRHARTRR